MLQKLRMLPQPDDVTCGHTSLHAVYSFFGKKIELKQLIDQIEMLEGGGTLAVYLGLHAMKEGFKAIVYSYNLRISDPSRYSLSREKLIDKLKKQIEFKDGKKFTKTSSAYLEFIENAGFETVDINEAPKAVGEAAVKATKLIGNGLYGVDIKEMDHKPYIIEINDTPNIDSGVEYNILGNKLYIHVLE